MNHFRYIYFADDDFDDREFFQEVIRDIYGDTCTLGLASNGVELLNHLALAGALLPEIIFLDLNMPLKGGMETLMELKADPVTAAIPVIIFSTGANMEEVKISKSLGASRYVVKPSDIEILKNTVLRLLSLDWANYIPSSDLSEFMITA